MLLDQQVLVRLQTLESQLKTLAEGLGGHRNAHRLRPIPGNIRLNREEIAQGKGGRDAFVGLASIWVSASDLVAAPDLLKGAKGEQSWIAGLTELRDLLASVLVKELEGRGSGEDTAYSTAKRRIEELDAELAGEKSRHVASRNELAKQVAAVADLRKEAESRAADAVRAMASVADADAEAKRLKATIEQAEARALAAERQASQASEKASSLEAELQAAREELSSTSSRLREKSQREHAAELAARDAEAASLKSDLSQATRALQEVEDLFAAAKREAEVLKLEIDEIRGAKLSAASANIQTEPLEMHRTESLAVDWGDSAEKEVPSQPALEVAPVHPPDLDGEEPDVQPTNSTQQEALHDLAEQAEPPSGLQFASDHALNESVAAYSHPGQAQPSKDLPNKRGSDRSKMQEGAASDDAPGVME